MGGEVEVGGTASEGIVAFSSFATNSITEDACDTPPIGGDSVEMSVGSFDV